MTQFHRDHASDSEEVSVELRGAKRRSDQACVVRYHAEGASKRGAQRSDVESVAKRSEPEWYCMPDLV